LCYFLCGGIFVVQGDIATKVARGVAIKHRVKQDTAKWVNAGVAGMMNSYIFVAFHQTPYTKKSLSRSEDRDVSSNSPALNGFFYRQRKRK
jgi:hypothetical protein